MSTWFQRWVDETVKSWPQQLGTRRNGPKTIYEKLATLTRQQTGRFGEKDVQARLDAMGYETALSPASRSPGDVWGYFEHRDIVHLAIVQVKSSLGPKPATLHDDDVLSLEELCRVSWRRFGQSRIVPTRTRLRQLIVSCGYAAVTVDSDLFLNNPRLLAQTNLASAYALYTVWTKGIPEEEALDFTDYIHSFRDNDSPMEWTSRP